MTAGGRAIDDYCHALWATVKAHRCTASWFVFSLIVYLVLALQ